MDFPKDDDRYEILHSIPDLVILTDRDLRILESNADSTQADWFAGNSKLSGKRITECVSDDLGRKLERLSILASHRDSPQTLEHTRITGRSVYYYEIRCRSLTGKFSYLFMIRDITSTKKARIDLQNEIMMARDLQYSTLPRIQSLADERFGFSVIYRPVGIISGDLYDFYMIDEDSFRFVVIDAVGHGIQASYLTMAIRTELERVKGKQYISPGRLLTYLNRSLICTFKSRDSNCSAFVLDLDFAKRKISYSSAGHPSQFISRNGSTLDQIGVRAPLIGMISGFQFPEKSIPMGDEFQVFLFTDGTFEFLDSSGSPYSEDRLHELIDLTLQKPSYRSDKSSLLTEVYNCILEISFENTLRDDLTFLHIYSR